MRRRERGQYALVMALGMVPLLGFAALSIDLAMLSLHESEADAVAFSAAHSAMVAWAHGRSKGESQSFAEALIDAHPSMLDGDTFQLHELAWGQVDRKTGQLTASDSVEAASARVVRSGDRSVGALFSGFLGMASLDVEGAAVSDQLPPQFDVDGCDFRFHYSGPRGGISRRDFHRVVTIEVENPGEPGWYHLYKDDVAESGSRQRNESAYFRLKNSVNPDGYPLDETATCYDEYIVVDYDNDGRIPDRVYIGTFYVAAGETNFLEMRHYCDGLHTVCPDFMDHRHTYCGRTHDSVHFDRGTSLCGEAL